MRIQLQERRLRERFGSRPIRLISLGIFRLGPFEEDRALVRLEDDLAFPRFARDPPDTVTSGMVRCGAGT